MALHDAAGREPNQPSQPSRASESEVMARLDDDTESRPAPTQSLLADERAELERLRVKMQFVPADEHEPQLIAARYEFRGRLGYGGMGEVLRVYDSELEDIVALKRLRGRHAGHTERLRDEARAMVRLREHPNVVTVLDVGADAERPFFTMQLVEGPTLRQWQSSEERRSDEDILRAYLDAARGLAAAHDLGIVHRDFKPDNVFMDSGVTAKVGDFGIAAATGASIDASTDEQEESLWTVGGTLPYMAPEQMIGQRADARTDQFSFCVALWEALAQVRPYTWKDADTQLRALAGEPAGAERLPAWLRGALRKGMSPRRAERWDSLDELIAYVERRLELPRRRRKLAAIGTGTALVAGLFAAALTGALRESPETCETYAEQAASRWSAARREQLLERSAEAPTSVAWAVTEIDELVGAWSREARSSCVDGRAPAADDPKRRCLERWFVPFDQALALLSERGDGETLLRAPDLLASLAAPGGDFCAVAQGVEDPALDELIVGARGSALVGERERADELSRAALERASSLASGQPYSSGEAAAHGVRAEVLLRSDRRALAPEEFSLAELHAIASRSPETLARARVFWAKLLASSGDPKDARAARRHLALAEPAFVAAQLPESALVRGEHLEATALAAESLGEFEFAASAYRRTANFFTEVGHPLLGGRSLSNLGTMHHMLGLQLDDDDERFDQLAQAELAYRDALQLFAFNDAPVRYPARLKAHFNLAAVLLAQSTDREKSEDAKRAGAAALEQLSLVATHAAPSLRLDALGLAVQLASNLRLEDEVRGFAERALIELDANEDAGVRIEPELELRVRAQVGLALVIALDDPRGAQLLGGLLDRQTELDPTLYWVVASDWIEHLEQRARCDEAAAVRAKLLKPEQPQWIEWMKARPTGKCRIDQPTKTREGEKHEQ